jgi:hypothetical protein
LSILRGGKDQSLNLRGAYLEVFGDPKTDTPRRSHRQRSGAQIYGPLAGH